MPKNSKYHSIQNPHPEVQQLGWEFLDEGAFNTAYKSPNGQLVLKIPKYKGNDTEDPHRSVKVFCEIYPEYAYLTHVLEIGPYIGWQMPFFKGREATDREIVRKLIDIYAITGRIVMDAPAKSNFICTDDNKVICIDVGFAFRLHHHLQRKPSVGSLTLMKNYEYQYQYHFFQKKIFIDNYQHTIYTIKALLLIQKHTPGLIKLDFLCHQPNCARYLASIYDHGQSMDPQAIDKKITMMEYFAFENLKKRCLDTLTEYLQSRCHLNETFYNFIRWPFYTWAKLELSWWSFIFRNHQLTYQKIERAQENIKQIHLCQNYHPLRQVIHQFEDPEELLRQRTHPSGLKKAYQKCQNDIFFAQNFMNMIG